MVVKIKFNKLIGNFPYEIPNQTPTLPASWAFDDINAADGARITINSPIDPVADRLVYRIDGQDRMLATKPFPSIPFSVTIVEGIIAGEQQSAQVFFAKGQNYGPVGASKTFRSNQSPSISVSRTPTTDIKVGNTVTLTATVSGYPTPTVVWNVTLNGSPVSLSGSGNTRSFVANTTGTLVFGATATNISGNASFSRTTSVSTANVTVPAAFTDSMITLTPISGGYSTNILSLPSDGGSPITKIWRRRSFDNGTTWSEAILHDEVSPFTGIVEITDATVGPRLVQFAAENNSGIAAWGPTPGKSITVASSAPTVLEWSTDPEVIYIDAPAQFTATSNGTRPVNYTFTHRGTTLANSVGIFSLGLPKSDEFTGSTTEISDAFTLVATNDAGSISISGSITAKKRPEAKILSFTRTPPYPMENEDTTVILVTQGEPDAVVTVTKDGVEIPIENTFFFGETSEWKLANMSPGDYEFTAEITRGESVSTKTSSVKVLPLSERFSDTFDNAPNGSYLPNRDDWSLDSGNVAAFPINSGMIDTPTGQPISFALIPDQGKLRQRVGAQLAAVPTSGGMQIGMVALFDPVTKNHVRIGLQSGSKIAVIEQIGGVSKTIAIVNDTETGGSNWGLNNRREVWFETDGTKYRVLSASGSPFLGVTLTPDTPPAGYGFLSQPFTGTRVGIRVAGTNARSSQLNYFTSEEATYYYAKATTQPQLWGIPQVGRTMEYIPGIWNNNEMALVANLEKTNNGGASWSLVKTMTPNEIYTITSAENGYQLRLRVVPSVGDTYVSPLTQIISSEAPFITRTTTPTPLQILVKAASVSHNVVANNYRVGYTRIDVPTDEVIVNGVGNASDINVTLPSDGIYDIRVQAQNSTGTWGNWSSPERYFEKTINEITFSGRNAAQMAICAISDFGPLEVVPMSGKTVSVDEPLPPMSPEIFDGKQFYLNGVMRSPVATSGKDALAWDNRLISDGKDVDGKGDYDPGDTLPSWYQRPQYPDGKFDINKMWVKWPAPMPVDETLLKAKSNPFSDFPLTNFEWKQGHRSGVLKQHAGLIVQNALSNKTKINLQAAPQLFKRVGRTPGNINLPGYAEMIDILTSMNLSTAPLGELPDKAGILERMSRFNPCLLVARGGTHNNDSHEVYSTFRRAYDFSQGNYYQYKLHSMAAHMLTTDQLTSDEKDDLLKNLIMDGLHSDWPERSWRLSAGIAQHHELPVILSRIARNQSFLDMTGTQKGNFLSMFFFWTEADLAKLSAHNNSSWPSFSRRRQVKEIVVPKPGDTWQNTGERFKVFWNGTLAAQGKYDERKQRFRGLEVVRESTGEILPFANVLSGGNYDPSKNALFGTDGKWSTPMAVDEWIYLRIPPQFTPIIGDPLWQCSVEGGVKWNAFNPTSEAAYRSINEPQGFLWLLHALGKYPNIPGSAWEACKKYTIKSREVGWPGTGYFRYNFTADGTYIRNMWSNYAATIGLG